jgi:hypothetical protein
MLNIVALHLLFIGYLMELKDFISNTLFEIQEGVNDAIGRIDSDDNNAVINPENPQYARTMQQVQFDIALTTSDEDKVGAKAGIKVAMFSVGADGSQSTKSSSVSRVQFSIPFYPPYTSTTDAD